MNFAVVSGLLGSVVGVLGITLAWAQIRRLRRSWPPRRSEHGARPETAAPPGGETRWLLPLGLSILFVLLAAIPFLGVPQPFDETPAPKPPKPPKPPGAAVTWAATLAPMPTVTVTVTPAEQPVSVGGRDDGGVSVMTALVSALGALLAGLGAMGSAYAAVLTARIQLSGGHPRGPGPDDATGGAPGPDDRTLPEPAEDADPVT